MRLQLLLFVLIVSCKGPTHSSPVSSASTSSAPPPIATVPVSIVSDAALPLPKCDADEWIYGTSATDPLFCALAPDDAKCVTDADCGKGTCVKAYLVTASGKPLASLDDPSRIITNWVCKYSPGLPRPRPALPADAGAPRTAYERARAAYDTGDYATARKNLDRRVFSGGAPSDEWRLLRKVCDAQGDPICIDKIRQLYR